MRSVFSYLTRFSLAYLFPPVLSRQRLHFCRNLLRNETQNRTQRDYVLAALKAKKHVLLNDPVSTSLPEFTEQQVYAKKYGKFIQFTTMFLHQYKVRSFIDDVLNRGSFGRIHTISSFVRLSFDDVEQVGVKFPLTPADGCIRVLGRFCVLLSTLFFSRVGSFAKSARVKFIHDGDIALSAECVVKYSEVRANKRKKKCNFFQPYFVRSSSFLEKNMEASLIGLYLW